MSRGFDGLKALAEQGVGINPLDGDLFGFVAGALLEELDLRKVRLSVR